MSRTTVIVALVLALGLVGAAWLLLGKSGPALGPAAVLSFDPAKVSEIGVTRPGGAYEAIRRGAIAGDWVVLLGGAGADEVKWPAAGAQWRGALRILSSVEGEPTGAAAPAGTAATRVSVSLDGGGSREMTLFGDERLGGRVMAADEAGRCFWIDGQIGDMLVKAGPRMWRDGAALAVGPGVSRAVLRGTAGTVSLARVQGRWALREPIQEAADADAVGRLLGAVGAVAVMDFLDGGAKGETGLDKPVAEIVVEEDVRDAEGGAARTVRQRLKVGRASDMTGKGLFASIERDGVEKTVVVAAESFKAITTDPVACVSRKAVEGAAADVERVSVTPAGGATRVYERGLDGWTSGGSVVSKENAGLVDALLALVTTERAEAVVFGEWPRGAVERAGTVELQSAAGAPAGSVEIGVADPDGKGARLVMHTGSVWRVYAAGAGKNVVEWVSGR